MTEENKTKTIKETKTDKPETTTDVMLFGKVAYSVSGGKDGKPMTVRASTADYFGFMKDRNLDKEVVEAVHKAHEEAYVEMAKTAVEQAVKNSCTCNVILPYGRSKALTVTGEDEHTSPAGVSRFHGKEVPYPAKTTYGRVKFGMTYKLPGHTELLRYATEAEKAIKENTRSALNL